jgi:hypothetical protein
LVTVNVWMLLFAYACGTGDQGTHDVVHLW